MEQLQAWGVSLCFAAAGCMVLQFLAPKTATGRLFEMLCGAVLLFCMISPLVKVDWGNVLSFDIASVATSENAQMQTYLREYLNGPLQDAVYTEGMSSLRSYGFSAEQITATMDIDEKGNIVIREIVVHLNAQQATQKASIQKVLEERFETTVTIKEV